jgi:orotate phosphoribosyltransferase-like protein
LEISLPKIRVKRWNKINFYGASWHSPVFSNTKKFRKLVNAYVKVLSSFYKKHKFDAIAFSGVSGSPLGGAISYALGVPMINVRKKGDPNHSYCNVIGNVNGPYVIVDDLIETGCTMNRIVKQITRVAKGDTKCDNVRPIGIFLYEANLKMFNGIPVFKVKI